MKFVEKCTIQFLNHPNENITYGDVVKVVRSLKEDDPLIKRNVINFAFKKYFDQKEKVSLKGKEVVLVVTSSIESLVIRKVEPTRKTHMHTRAYACTQTNKRGGDSS